MVGGKPLLLGPPIARRGNYGINRRLQIWREIFYLSYLCHVHSLSRVIINVAVPRSVRSPFSQFPFTFQTWYCPPSSLLSKNRFKIAFLNRRHFVVRSVFYHQNSRAKRNRGIEGTIRRIEGPRASGPHHNKRESGLMSLARLGGKRENVVREGFTQCTLGITPGNHEVGSQKRRDWGGNHFWMGPSMAPARPAVRIAFFLRPPIVRCIARLERISSENKRHLFGGRGGLLPTGKRGHRTAREPMNPFKMHTRVVTRKSIQESNQSDQFRRAIKSIQESQVEDDVNRCGCRLEKVL